MAQPLETGRTNQKARTRQAILHAARNLLARGERPSLDEIATEAQVSRATAYRYFPGLDALLSEAAVEERLLSLDEILADAPADPAARLARVDDAFDRACRQADVAVRLMLSRILERSALTPEDGPPLRQNRRTPMIEEAIAPIASKLDSEAKTRLVRALGMIVGTEGYIVLTDVLGLDETEARNVRHWMIEALVDASVKG